MYNVVLTTVSNKEQALLIARELTKSRLCACVNILPSITSVYFWKDELCEESEFLLLIKSRSGDFKKIEAKILELHPYELPEIISLSIEKAHKKYANWIDEAIRQPS